MQSNTMYMYFKHVKLDTCADFSNICGVYHMLFAIINKFMYIFMLINYSRMSYIVTSVPMQYYTMYITTLFVTICLIMTCTL